jgi:superfamily II DNA or RNA helicase
MTGGRSGTSKLRAALRKSSSALASVRSWEDFRRHAKLLTTTKAKGDAFEALAKAYLLLEPEYASKLKHVWLHCEVPGAVAEKLKLPGSDQGIDLVAETNDGEFWAVQCKYRQDTNHSLTWRDISTFTGLAFGVCRGISFGLICSTTERITHVVKDQERIGFCALDVWQALDPDFFGRLKAHLDHKPDLLEPLKPRPHQREAVKAGHQHFVVEKADRGKLIMPCGSGKSLTAYWIAGELEALRIVIAVPSLALIRQTLKVWLRETMANRQAVEWICVCSDESAGRIERDDVTVLRQDLGVPCVTNPGDIASWLKRKHHGLTVVFTTYQSGEALSQAARSARFRFDLGIMDEAHKTVGATDKLFSHLLHDANLPICRRIFMTATERRYAGQSDTVLSMDNPAIYGETFHLLSFKRALEYAPPILSDYKIISIAVSRDEVAQLIRKNVFVKPDKGRWSREIEADMLASLIALRKAMARHPIRHAVSFHSSIRRAELFKTHNDTFNRAFPKYGSLETFHVSGKTPTGTRARIIGEFEEARRALITNARCLTEGVDVPGIDCVLFADPRRSAVDIVQAVGRALRPAPRKKLGYVIVPILHDADATADDIFESQSFQEILTTLRALAANDDRIIEYFRTVSQGRQRTGGGTVEFDMDERLAKRIDLAQFVRDIDLRCWDRLAKLSWRPFEAARAFAHELKLKNFTEWRVFCRGDMPRLTLLPADIPSTPWTIYADRGWVSLGDWLGTGRISSHLRKYRAFRAARTFARALKLKSQTEWKAFTQGRLPRLGRLPNDIPVTPGQVYASSGWAGWGDWLGTGRIADQNKRFLPFVKARSFVRRLHLKTVNDWYEYCRSGRKPQSIPASPENTYKDSGWTGIRDWLGTKPGFDGYLPFKEARRFVHALKLRSTAEWFEYCKSGEKPDNIPTAPRGPYRKHWKGSADWLGHGRLSPQEARDQFWPFEKARRFVRKLGLKNYAEWNRYARSGNKPLHIPSNPYGVYGDAFTSMPDWLGTKTGFVGFLKYSEAEKFARRLRACLKSKIFD